MRGKLPRIERRKVESLTERLTQKEFGLNGERLLPETIRDPRNSSEKPLYIIEARPAKLLAVDWTELSQYRELLLFMIWRDILIRYKQTVLGALWEILKPLSMMMVLTVVMGYIVTVPSEGVPYPLFYYSGVVIWTFFSQTMNNAAGSVLSQPYLITKVYFPRIIIPFAVVVSGLFDMIIAFTLLVPLMIWYGILPSARLFFLPVSLLLTFVSALGLGLAFCALIVKYRDFQNVLPVFTQLMFFLTPVFYPLTVIPEKWLYLYGFNPIAGAVEALRWSLFGTSSAPWIFLAQGVVSATVLLAGGLLYFERSTRTFADWL